MTGAKDTLGDVTVSEDYERRVEEGIGHMDENGRMVYEVPPVPKELLDRVERMIMDEAGDLPDSAGDLTTELTEPTQSAPEPPAGKEEEPGETRDQFPPTPASGSDSSQSASSETPVKAPVLEGVPAELAEKYQRKTEIINQFLSSVDESMRPQAQSLANDLQRVVQSQFTNDWQILRTEQRDFEAQRKKIQDFQKEAAEPIAFWNRFSAEPVAAFQEVIDWALKSEAQGIRVIPHEYREHFLNEDFSLEPEPRRETKPDPSLAKVHEELSYLRDREQQREQAARNSEQQRLEQEARKWLTSKLEGFASGDHLADVLKASPAEIERMIQQISGRIDVYLNANQALSLDELEQTIVSEVYAAWAVPHLKNRNGRVNGARPTTAHKAVDRSTPTAGVSSWEASLDQLIEDEARQQV